MSRGYDIMGVKEKQAAAKQTFVFLTPLTSEPPAQQAISTQVRVREFRTASIF